MLHFQHILNPYFYRLSFWAVLLCFAGFISPDTLQAKDNQLSSATKENTEISIDKKVIVVTGRVSGGFMTGKANELVYWPAGTTSKLSQLTWTTKNVLMIGGGITVQSFGRLKLNADFTTKATEGSNALDDYDWLWSTSDWSDRSHHDDVSLTTGRMFDINVEYTFFQRPEVMLSGIIGYKQDEWAWEARGGDYLYSVNSFRDTAGFFTPGVLGITYEQSLSVPYIGIGFQANMNPILLSGRLIGSVLASASDNDQHHLRSLSYDRDFDRGNMFGFTFNCTYKFTNHLALMGSFQFNKYFTTRGDTTITNLSTGTVTKYDDIAGMDNQTGLFLLSFLYTF